MFRSRNFATGLSVSHISTCDFKLLERFDNNEVLKRAGKMDDRLAQFMESKMGIIARHWAKEEVFAIDLARSALSSLLTKEPKIAEEADFLIFCGISNSLPTVCHASLLANEFNFKKASCFDLKSGCSSGVLGLIQALFWLNHGAKRGVIVCSETLSKFSDPAQLQMSGAVGDGAVALCVDSDPSVEVLSVTQGTDATHFKTMYVHAPFPVETATYKREDYRFKVVDNAVALERSAELWRESLADSLSLAGLEGGEVTTFCAHQFDGVKLRTFANEAGISEEAVLENFSSYGNIGCPSVFLTYHDCFSLSKFSEPKQTLMFHAVGGGQSWASLILRKR